MAFRGSWAGHPRNEYPPPMKAELCPVQPSDRDAFELIQAASIVLGQAHVDRKSLTALNCSTAINVPPMADSTRHVYLIDRRSIPLWRLGSITRYFPPVIGSTYRVFYTGYPLQSSLHFLRHSINGVQVLPVNFNPYVCADARSQHVDAIDDGVASIR